MSIHMFVVSVCDVCADSVCVLYVCLVVCFCVLCFVCVCVHLHLGVKVKLVAGVGMSGNEKLVGSSLPLFPLACVFSLPIRSLLFICFHS